MPEDFSRHEPRGLLECRQFSDEGASNLVARELTETLAERCAMDRGARNAVETCLGELCDNVIHHALTQTGGFAAAQGFPNVNRFEAAIADLGIGIPRSLSGNPEFADIEDHAAAIRTAMSLGVTSKPAGSGHPRRHAGYGLAVTSELLRENGGRLVVRSGTGEVRVGSQESSRSTTLFPGTLIVFEARVDSSLDLRGVYDRLLGAYDEDS
jgi:anti-sigma regulatory factor (Ser/Thr protein kinase)